MNTSTIILHRVLAGQSDDATVSAYLDAAREDNGTDLLSAVLELALHVQANVEARDLAEAAGYLAQGSALRERVQAEIIAECPELSPHDWLTVICDRGDRPPHAVENRHHTGNTFFATMLVTVGARWIKRVVSRLQVEDERLARKQRRSKRSR